MFPDVVSVGALVYVGEEASAADDRPRVLVERLLKDIGIAPEDMQAALFRAPSKEGRWRKKLWSAVEEAISDPDVLVLDLLVGTSEDVRFTGKLQLRRSSRFTSRSPLHWSFACELRTWSEDRVVGAGRAFVEWTANVATPLSGFVFRAPTFGQAMHEIHMSHNLGQESKAFQDRIGFDMYLDNYWTKARRLYPITLLGPKLASQVTAADALAAGALAVQEINGSLLIDSYPTVVETWDPEYLKATVNLRKWLWPHTIQNPADAVGLGLKLPKR
jgi:hypothetical protein